MHWFVKFMTFIRDRSYELLQLAEGFVEGGGGERWGEGGLVARTQTPKSMFKYNHSLLRAEIYGISKRASYLVAIGLLGNFAPVGWVYCGKLEGGYCNSLQPVLFTILRTYEVA